MLPALVVGVVDGVARSRHRSRWVSPLRVVAFLLVTMLALGITLVAWFFVALTESNLDAAIGPLPLGTYLGALVGMEAMAGAGPGAAEPSSVEYGVGMLELAGRTPPLSLHRWRVKVGWPSTAAVGPRVSIEVQC